LSQFCRQHENILLKVAELPSRNLIYSVLSGRSELAIGPFQKQMDAFTTLSLYREMRYLVVSPNHADYEKIIQGDRKALRQAVMITSFLDNPEMRPAIQRIRDRFKSVWEISSLSMRIHMVDQGQGLAFINSKLLEEDPICRQFRVVEGLTYGSIERAAGIYYKKGRVLSSAAEQFVELCEGFWSI
jgi:DNA-binding transcriptional LysR family regulator